MSEIAAAHPNTIILISIDDLRYDAVGVSDITQWYDKFGLAQFRNTPNLDELGQKGTLFREASSTSSYTPPSHASLFTGQYPKDHGVKTFFNDLDNDKVTLAEFLRDYGYQTYAWIENQALDILGITRGFDEVVCPFQGDEVNLFDFINRIGSTSEKRFLFLHLFDVHKPYCYTTGGTERFRYNREYLSRLDSHLPPFCQPSDFFEDAKAEARNSISNYGQLNTALQEYGQYWSLDYLIREKLDSLDNEDKFEHLVRLYLAGVEHFDTGRLADILDLLNEELFSNYFAIVTSDHGEAKCRWGDRIDFMNSFNVSEQAVKIPFIVDTDLFDLPDESPNSVNHVDVLPTIAKLLSHDFDFEISGTSIFDTMNTQKPNRTLYHESWYYEGGAGFFGQRTDARKGGLSEVAVRSYPHKLIYSFEKTGNPPAALYNLASDPYETRNLISDSERAEPLGNLLDEHLQGVQRTLSGTEDDDHTDNDELRDHLSALGYLE